MGISNLNGVCLRNVLLATGVSVIKFHISVIKYIYILYVYIYMSDKDKIINDVYDDRAGFGSQRTTYLDAKKKIHPSLCKMLRIGSVRTLKGKPS